MKKSIIVSAIIVLMAFTGCGSPRFVTGNPACEYDKMPAQLYDQLKTYTNNIDMKLKPEKGDTVAYIKTNYGTIKIFFYEDKAPETTKNFIELAKSGKYDGTAFHRVVDCFMIQGGDFGDGGYSYKGPGTYLKDEFGEGLKNLRGAVSMANRGPNTGGSQFFIVQADYGAPWLDGKHAVFGYVYEGMDVVDEIAKIQTDGDERPVKDATMEKVVIDTY